MQKTLGGRSAIQNSLNEGKLRARQLACVGKIGGTLRISHVIDLRKTQISESRATLSARFAVPLGCLRIRRLIWKREILGGGLLIHSDPFALIDCRLFLLAPEAPQLTKTPDLQANAYQALTKPLDLRPANSLFAAARQGLKIAELRKKTVVHAKSVHASLASSGFDLAHTAFKTKNI